LSNVFDHETAYTYEGLGSYVFTNSIQRSWRVAEALEYGLVGINEGVISTEVRSIPYSTRLSCNVVFAYGFIHALM